MRAFSRFLRPFLTPATATAASAVMLSGGLLSARTLEHLYSDNTGKLEFGSLARGADGALYGTTRTGGTCNKGTLFKILPDGRLLTLLSFNGWNGSHPVGGLTPDEAGNLYGATEDEGPLEAGGTVFRLSPEGGLTTMAKFAAGPVTPLTRAADGHFYGGAGSGGFKIFRMTPQGDLKVLASATRADPGSPGEGIQGRLLQASDGNFYGVTESGGRNFDGTVFRMTPGGEVTWLFHFDDSISGSPEGPLVEMGGKLYGVTRAGGAENRGTIFSLTFSGTHKVLESFRGPNGITPYAGLSRGRDGNVYGTASDWGPLGGGVVFRITPDENITTVASFVSTYGLDTPKQPLGELLDGGDGSFYGVCQGKVYRMAPGGQLSTVARFDQAGGETPGGSLSLQTADTVIGTTVQGGANGRGTIFRLSLSGDFTRLFSFPPQEFPIPSGPLIPLPDGGILGTTYSSIFHLTPGGVFNSLNPSYYSTTGLTPGDNGDFYGASSFGTSAALLQVSPEGAVTTVVDQWKGSDPKVNFQRLTSQGNGSFIAGCRQSGAQPGNGAIYSLGTDGTLKSLAAFDGLNGRWPSSELVKGPDGAWYGTTDGSDIPDGGGTVYRYSPEQGISTLWNFKSSRMLFSFAPLLQDEWGNFWGTATVGSGEDSTQGMVFRLSPDGELTTVVSFTGPNGANPRGGLAKGPKGSLYGTTSRGGADNGGTIFRIAANGTFSTLVSFNLQNGYAPASGLTLGSDGNFYGTTPGGGSTGGGTVFKMTPGGTLTTLHTFPYNAGQPQSELTEGDDGAFYGTASGAGYGFVFRITKEGILTTLHTMNRDGSEGIVPLGRLVKDAAGNFYGTNSYGFNGISGSVFRITPAGGFSTLTLFRDASSRGPKAGLLLARDGNFYGTTGGSTEFNDFHGSVFRLTPAGELTLLKTLGEMDALTVGDPRAPLIEGGDGYFYGTSAGGSPGVLSSSGKIFRVSLTGDFDVLARFENIPDLSSFSGTYPAGGLAVGRDGYLYGATANGGRYALGSLFRLSLSGDLTTLWSFDGLHSATPVGTPLFGPDGHLYGAASQLSLWRLRMPPSFTGPADTVTDAGAVLHATVLPEKAEEATPAFLEYSTRPDMAGAIRLPAATLPAGSGPREVAAALTGLLPDTVYYYRAVTGSADAASDAGEIRRFATLSGIQAWRQRFFGTIQDQGEAANLADPDADGMVNLLEYALLGDPKAFTPSPGTFSRGESGWKFHYLRRAGAARNGVRCQLQFSPALSPVPAAWSSDSLIPETVIPENAESEKVTLPLPASEKRGFLRIQVSLE